MSYFLSNHSQVDLFTNEDGLRAPQLGAVGALIAHGTKSIEQFRAPGAFVLLAKRFLNNLAS